MIAQNEKIRTHTVHIYTHKAVRQALEIRFAYPAKDIIGPSFRRNFFSLYETAHMLHWSGQLFSRNITIPQDLPDTCQVPGFHESKMVWELRRK